MRDIDKYAERAGNADSLGLGVHGIFVDETMNLYSEEVKQYLDQVDWKVKKCEKIGGNKIVSRL